jgi:signal transduction histidine kinase
MHVPSGVERLRARPGVAAFLVGLGAAIVVLIGTITQRGTTTDALLAAGSLAVASGAVVAWSMRRRQEREARAERASLETRLAIARDLHDVVAHHVSVIGVQAGAARRLLATRPAEASTALEAIEASSRSAVQELGRLVSTLRDPGAVGHGEPAPTLDALPAVVDAIRAAGLPVTLTLEAVPGGVLPPTLELTIVRIVQEALTNVVRHSPGAATTVDVRLMGPLIVVAIVNGAAATASPSGASGGTGSGLRGIRERVALFGGTLDAGPRPDGGYAVEARLPVP